MPIDVISFFPPGAHVIALPNNTRPRLFIAAGPRRRLWLQTKLYPAFRRRAQLYRLALRFKTLLGVGATVQAGTHSWALAAFLRDTLPDLSSVVVLKGTLGPTQKIVVQLWDRTHVLGYLKYAETPTSRARLQNEYRVLSEVPKSISPEIVKYASFAQGDALVTGPVPGRALSARLPPSPDLSSFAISLVGTEKYEIQNHPWVAALRAQGQGVIDPWLESLAARLWPVSTNHGDFAPWNIFLHGSTLRAIDWEYGTAAGFPYLDLAYYILQTAALVNRWPPARARAYAIRWLSFRSDLALTPDQAESIVNLCAYHAFRQSLEDGRAADAPLQAWRRAIWSHVP
jgi:hypothetical protein